MTRTELLQFMRSHSLVVQTSVSPTESPQSAVVAVAVSDDFELIFDTIDTSRKAQNLKQNPKMSFVIGGWREDDERTVQYDGVAEIPNGTELGASKALYFSRFPDGRSRENWPGLIYIRAKPLWIRYSDFNKNPPEIVEFDF